MTKLILFDIDGTLVSRHQGHMEAFAVAFKQVYGVYGSVYMVPHNGRTDQQIIRDVLESYHIPRDTVDAKMDECMQVMCDYYSAVGESLTTDIFDGIDATLSTLAGSDAILGLVTGNLETIAHVKLERANIDRYFQLGGFGNEALQRSDLVLIAIDKAEQQFGFEYTGDNVFLVGDTPSDVEAAITSGVTPIAVSSGAFDADQLRTAGAATIIDGVANTEAFTAAIT